MYCTGYSTTFPFFDPIDKLVDFGGEETRCKFFGPLYKRMISIRQPKLFFVSFVDYTILDDYVAEVQAMLVKHYIDGSVKLPSVEEMMKDYERDLEEERANSKDGSLANYFRLSPLKHDLVYLEDLHKMMGFIYESGEDKRKEWMKRKLAVCMKHVEFFLKGNLLQYKKFNFIKEFPQTVKATAEFS